jgi:hypothetical protein
METSRFYAPVEKVKTSDVFPKFSTNSYNEYLIIVTHEKEKRIVSSCSDNYCLISNRDIFPAFEKELEDHFKVVPKYTEKNLSQFYVDYRLIDNGFKSIDLPNKDKLLPMMRIHHSYNKASSFNINFGYYREICTNGLWSFRSDGEYSFKHFNGNQKQIFGQIIKSAQRFIEKAPDNEKVFLKLLDHSVQNVEQRIEEVVKKTGYLKRVQEEIVARAILEHDKFEIPMTDWLIYNAFNYQLNHNKSIESPEERKMNIDKEIFEFLLKS